MILNRYNITPSKPRLVICGTGQYGGIVAEIALDVGYEIVGAYNRAGAKIGRIHLSTGSYRQCWPMG